MCFWVGEQFDQFVVIFKDVFVIMVVQVKEYFFVLMLGYIYFQCV